jgi:hypothetical protein
VASKIAAQLPGTNQPGLSNNIVGNVPFKSDVYNYDGRIDHNFNERSPRSSSTLRTSPRAPSKRSRRPIA